MALGQGPDQVSSMTVLLAPPIPRPNQGWRQELQGKGRGGVEGREAWQPRQRDWGRLPIMGTSAMKTLRIEFATLRNENQAACGHRSLDGPGPRPAVPKAEALAREPVLKRHDTRRLGPPALQNRKPLPPSLTPGPCSR